MTRITHPTNSNYCYSRLAASQETTQPDLKTIERMNALTRAKDATPATPNPDKHTAFLQTLPDHPSLQNYLVQIHKQSLKGLESQGHQAARDVMADSRVKTDEIMTTLAKYRNAPKALAAFFEELGPQNSTNALRYVNYHARDAIRSSAYTRLADRDDKPLGEGDKIRALRREQRHELREILAEALAKGARGGLSDRFLKGMAEAATTDPKVANQLSDILSQCSDEALVPLKAALLNKFMTSDKAFNGVNNTNTLEWVRATTLLLGSDPSGQLAELLHLRADSNELTHFISTMVQQSAKEFSGLDGGPYYDDYYQQGLSGLLKGVSQLQGDEYTVFKAHVFSAASDAMGENHIYDGLTEGLKALFMSDSKGIAVEIRNSSNDDIQSLSALAYLFREAIFQSPDPNDKFVETVSLTLKKLYQAATDSLSSEEENELNGRALGLMFGNLQAAFKDAKVDNKINQQAIRNCINAFTGLATLFPHLSMQISALKDGAIVPFFDFFFNIEKRARAQDIDSVDTVFRKLEDAVVAGFNGYREITGRKIVDIYDSSSSKAYTRSSEDLGKEQ